MKIKMKSIHANIINETVSASATDVRAQIEIGYSHDEKNRLQLNYHISVGKQNSGHLYILLKKIFQLMKEQLKYEIILKQE